MEQNEQNYLGDMNLQVDQEVKGHFNNSAKWTRFISITVFIFCGIMLIGGILGGSTIVSLFDKASAGSTGFLFKLSGKLLILIVVFFVLVMAFINYFLYNYAVKIKSALQNENVETFNKGLSSLKTFFIITTVFAILTLINSLYELFT